MMITKVNRRVLQALASAICLLAPMSLYCFCNPGPLPLAKANAVRFLTKYQDDEGAFVYYGYRYYNASTGRWLSRDPLGEESFLRQYRADKDEVEQMQLLRETQKPSYNFVLNNTVNCIDKTGLDRWLIHNMHSAVVVEVWNECCTKVIGYKRIEFTPAGGWWVLLTAGVIWKGEVVITGASKPSGWNVWHYSSGCKGDKMLLKWAQNEQQNPPWYSIIFYNCNDFAEEVLMEGLPAGGPLPWPHH